MDDRKLHTHTCSPFAARGHFQEDLGPAADVRTEACTLYEILGERLAAMGRTRGETSKHELQERERNLLERLLRSMMAYEPRERITAAEALQEPWMLE